MNNADATYNGCIVKNFKLNNKDMQICVNRYIVGGESFVHLVAKLYIAWIMKNKNYTPYFECDINVNDRHITVDVCGYKRSIHKPFIVAEIYTRTPVHVVADRIRELRTLGIPIIIVAPNNLQNNLRSLPTLDKTGIIFISLEGAIARIAKNLALYALTSLDLDMNNIINL